VCNIVVEGRRIRAMELVLWGTLCVALAPMVVAGVMLSASALPVSAGAERSVVDAGLFVNDPVLGETRQAGSASGIWSTRNDHARAEDEIIWALRQLRPDVGPEPSRFAPFVARGSVLAQDSACEARDVCVGAAVVALRSPEMHRHNAKNYAPELVAAGDASWPSELSFARDDDETPIEELTSNVGDASFAVSASLASGQSGRRQSLSFTGVGAFVGGVYDVSGSSFSGRAARTFSNGVWSLRPQIAIDATHFAFNDVRLDAGPSIDTASSNWLVATRPSVAFEGEFGFARGLTFTPHLAAEATWNNQDEFFFMANLLDAPIGRGGLSSLMSHDDLYADFAAGFDIAADDRFQLSVRVARRIGDPDLTESGELTLRMRF